MKKFQQLALLKSEPQPPPVAIKAPQQPQITGLIRRQLEELDTCDGFNWIASNAKLKFKREGSNDG